MLILSILLIGFSIFCGMLLIISNLFHRDYQSHLTTKLAGFILIVSLLLIQLYHLDWLLNYKQLMPEVYPVLLFLVAPCFYLYSRQIMVLNANPSLIDLMHFVPLIAGMVLPYEYSLPLAFFLGGGYVIWLAKVVFSLRAQRQRFRIELIALGILFTIAVSVLILAFIQPMISDLQFYSWYSILIGLAFFISALTLLQFPTLSEQVEEAVQASYVESTLKNIDCTEKIKQLKQLMEQDKLFQNEELKLKSLAVQLDLSGHQLSELINREFGKGFSRFIREYRVKEAQRILIDEPSASVLSVGLSVGFTSQSNFYTAFREITGITPGKYRKDPF